MIQSKCSTRFRNGGQPRTCTSMPAGAAIALLAVFAFPATAEAAGARKDVPARPGEIVLLRAVPTRPAVRQAPPGLALLVDTTPNSQLDAALASMELSDGEAGSLSAPVTSAVASLQATVTTHPFAAAPRGADGQATPRGAASIPTPLSVVGNATRGVGSTVTGALQALPLGKGPGG